MFLFLLLWNVVLCNEATNLIPFEGINLCDNKSNTNSVPSSSNNSTPPIIKKKKKRNLPGTPDPNAEVIALTPKILLATNRFICDICQKGFQREQNLQLHRRGHNLPFKLKQGNSSGNRKKVYTCPEPTCVHHHPSRALGDLTGIKKHYSRKHCEKTWRCEKCIKTYAVYSDWKAHSKTCCTREYRCDCGITFSRKDSFATHRAFCSALAQESARISANYTLMTHHTPPPPPPVHHHAPPPPPPAHHHAPPHHHQSFPPIFSIPPPPHCHHHHLFTPNPTPMWDPPTQNPSPLYNIKRETLSPFDIPPQQSSATALLQKAASIGFHSADHVGSSMAGSGMPSPLIGHFGHEGRFTRNFLNLTTEDCVRASLRRTSNANKGLKELLSFTEMGPAQDNHDRIRGHSGVGFGFGVDPIWK